MSLPRYLRPSRFFIQWHLTERCNWHCRHCYLENERVDELPFDVHKKILSQCIDLFETLHIKPGYPRINMGGGEPFMRKDFLKFLRLLSRYKDSIQITLMTNGSFITNTLAKDLKKWGVRSVQVSIEGLEQENDYIRGKGAFKKTIRAVRILRKNDVHTAVSLTVTRRNVSEIESLAIYLKEIGVNRLGLRRYVPIGRGEQLKEYMLSPLELRDFYFRREGLGKRLNEMGQFHISYGCEDGVFVDRHNPSWYNCGVVNGNYLNICANGDILVCRREPTVVGNVVKDNLLEVHFSSQKLWAYRDLSHAHPLCKKCPSFNYCLGGAKCITAAYFGTPFAPDPQCWRLFNELPESGRFSKG
jgi:radical SAM protein with 4Fe4S-binding SPASM domain